MSKIRREHFYDNDGKKLTYTSVTQRFADEVTYEKRGDDWYRIIHVYSRISYDVKKEGEEHAYSKERRPSNCNSSARI